jgi:dephospho-CoA kinase
MLVAVTGGIAAGKSTVARMLAECGATVVDADQLARDAVAPGSPGLAAVVKEFGADVLTSDGALDRPALGRLVFGDESARLRLEAIIHPEVGRLSADAFALCKSSGAQQALMQVWCWGTLSTHTGARSTEVPLQRRSNGLDT